MELHNYTLFLELAAEFFTEVKSGHTLERLDVEEASKISRNACVSPCSLVLALLYLERLKDCNPEYLQRVAPSDLFLVSLVLHLYCLLYKITLLQKLLLLKTNLLCFVDGC